LNNSQKRLVFREKNGNVMNRLRLGRYLVHLGVRILFVFLPQINISDALAREPRAELSANLGELLLLDITKKDNEVIAVRFGFGSFCHCRDVRG